MHTRAVGIAAVLVFAVAACDAGSPDAQPGRGVVKAVELEARKVTLDHGDIPDLMKAMTMTFEVAPGVALESFPPGSVVEFRVVHEGGAYTVVELRHAGS